MDNSSEDSQANQGGLSPAARRALAEAAERRKRANKATSGSTREVGGRSGPDPARYGDWEKDGIASDF